MAKKDKLSAQADILNFQTYDYYFNRLLNVAMSVYEWKNLPDTIDERFLELSLLKNGMCLFFKDDALGYLALPCAIGGSLNVYNIPTQRRAYAANGYHAERTEKDSVIIYYNYTHTIPIWDLQMFAQRIANIERSIDVNVAVQKYPAIVNCDENERLTMVNLMEQYMGNIPFIFGTKQLNTKQVQVLNLNAPLIADKLDELRVSKWNDALTYLGVSNINIVKKERLIQDEVQRNMGGTLASRNSPLEMRKMACAQINAMFPELNVDVDYREDMRVYDDDDIAEDDETDGEQDE